MKQPPIEHDCILGSADKCALHGVPLREHHPAAERECTVGNPNSCALHGIPIAEHHFAVGWPIRICDVTDEIRALFVSKHHPCMCCLTIQEYQELHPGASTEEAVAATCDHDSHKPLGAAILKEVAIALAGTRSTDLPAARQEGMDRGETAALLP